jgi:hypothetical protein
MSSWTCTTPPLRRKTANSKLSGGSRSYSQCWDEIREKEFPNRVFSDMAGVVRTLEAGLPRLAADRDRVRSICAWPWIVSLNLNARQNNPPQPITTA